MPLIAPNVVRFSIVATLHGEDCINIVDMRATPGVDQTRDEMCFAIAGDIMNNWDDHLKPILNAVYEPQEVRWVDLNSADGSVGVRTSTDATAWPSFGGIGSAPLPSSVYAKITKVLQGRDRGQRQGIMRLGGLSESDTDPGNGNRLSNGKIEALDDALEAFKDGIQGGVSPVGRDADICVVHTVDQAYVGNSLLSRYQTNTVVGTLKRRMPGYGD